MPTVRGRSDVKRFMAQLPAQIEGNVLRGAARAAATVVAVEAKLRSNSREVADAVKVSSAGAKDGRVIAKVQVKGPGAYLAPWQEYGTAPHFIRVDESQRQGMSVGRINTLHKSGSLVIGGHFVGDTVFHPGARAHPFLRPALDMKEGEAIAAAQTYINSRVTRSGIVGSDDIAGEGA